MLLSKLYEQRNIIYLFAFVHKMDSQWKCVHKWWTHFRSLSGPTKRFCVQIYYYTLLPTCHSGKTWLWSDYLCTLTRRLGKRLLIALPLSHINKKTPYKATRWRQHWKVVSVLSADICGNERSILISDSNFILMPFGTCVWPNSDKEYSKRQSRTLSKASKQVVKSLQAVCKQANYQILFMCDLRVGVRATRAYFSHTVCLHSVRWFSFLPFSTFHHSHSFGNQLTTAS